MPPVFALEAMIIIIAGFVLLRFAGKKVIAEMTPLEMVTTLAIGTVIGHAESYGKLWKTILTISVFVAILIVFQYLALKWPFFQKLIIGKPTLVIKDGTVLNRNLSRLRMTVEQLEMRVRERGISQLSDVRTATVEVNGQLGYELIESAKPVTQGQLSQLLKELKLEQPKAEPKQHDVFDQLRNS
jgi:uncharacterized membrane protein YcaP (DUF421 family)